MVRLRGARPRHVSRAGEHRLPASATGRVSIAAEKALDRLSGPYTLVLADPPYAAGAWELLEKLAASPLLAAHATIVLEHSARDEPRGDLGRFHLAKVLRHGDSAVSIYLSAGAGSPQDSGQQGGE
jgi:16S rRNA G966 N2-methylase RsmD